jgi:hypothetical protein
MTSNLIGPNAASTNTPAEPVERVPLALNEANVLHHHYRDRDGNIINDDVIARAGDAVATARGLAEKLHDAVTKVLRDAALTDGARLVKARRLAASTAEAIGKSIDSALTTARAALDESRKDTWSPSPGTSVRDVMLENRVADALRGMTDKERHAAINAAIESGDDLVASAVINGPALTIGLSHEMREGYRGRWRIKNHRANVEREHRLAKVAEAIERAAVATERWLSNLVDGSEVARRSLAAEQSIRALETASAAVAQR